MGGPLLSDTYSLNSPFLKNNKNIINNKKRDNNPGSTEVIPDTCNVIADFNG